MSRAQRVLTSVLPQAGLFVLLGVLTFGLTGCYTQLQTAESGRTAKAPPAEQSAQTHSADEAAYADEYRREYREGQVYDDGVGARYDNGGYGGDGYGGLYEYKYQYKYKYGATSPYNSRFDRLCDEAFFHDPWYYDSHCRSRYGSRFSLSFHFGSPHYYGHHYRRGWSPWSSSWYSHGYGGWGHGSYATYYGGNHYYYGDVDSRDDDRTHRPRGGTIGRGAASADGRTSIDRSDRGRATQQAGTSRGRIGRSEQATETRRASIDRSATTRTEQGRVGRTERARTDQSGRVGRSTTRDADRDRTTRTRRSERADRPERQRPRTVDRSSRGSDDRGTSRSDTRTRSRSDDSSDDGNRRSQYRVPTRDLELQPTPRTNRDERTTPRSSTREWTRSSKDQRPTFDRSDNSSSRSTRTRSTRTRSSDDQSNSSTRSSSRDRSSDSGSSRSRSRSSDRGSDDDRSR